MAVVNQVLLPSGRRAHLAAQCWCVVCLVELITQLDEPLGERGMAGSQVGEVAARVQCLTEH